VKKSRRTESDVMPNDRGRVRSKRLVTLRSSGVKAGRFATGRGRLAAGATACGSPMSGRHAAREAGAEQECTEKGP
jgi:hypothetical protein